MNGIELSRLFFEEYGRDMIEKGFAPYREKIAAGLVGQGSERYGYDDEHSKDHDFCAGFCIFVDNDTEKEIGFELMTAYRKLPREFMGVSTRERTRSGKSRYGVVTYDGLFVPLVGNNYRHPTASDYLYTPQNYFADATNGSIFYDPSGIFTGIYNGIKNGMPEDVRLKKISANAAIMAQSGQYNYARCLAHGEQGAAVFALCEFVKSTSALIYLLNRSFMPYYKWMLKGLSRLEILGNLSDSLEFLLTADNDEHTRFIKSEIIEDVSAKVAEELKKKGLSSSDSDYLEEHAVSIASGISDVNIRNLHLLSGADV
ncbi:MAG: DUF4037 domain-containing protein [Clostridia bacterium]|nr:DUF4037 domain-containing protein [Clostridia bacterium]